MESGKEAILDLYGASFLQMISKQQPNKLKMLELYREKKIKRREIFSAARTTGSKSKCFPIHEGEKMEANEGT